jgi:CheY-like chemotaxis protein
VAGRLIVVVVDDDRDTFDGSAEWLELEGDMVVLRRRPTLLEPALGGRTPTVCIVDLQLTTTTGLEVRDLRDRLPEFRDTVPIVLTGMNRSKAERFDRGGPDGEHHSVQQTIDPAKLSSTIDGAVAAHRLPFDACLQHHTRPLAGTAYRPRAPEDTASAILARAEDSSRLTPPKGPADVRRHGVCPGR